MARKSNLERYIDAFTVQTGEVANRDKLIWAIQQTLREEDLKLFFLLPMMGSLTRNQFQRKALRAGFSEEQFNESLTRLHEEGFVISHNLSKKGRVFERAFVSFTLEQQVRRKRSTELGAAYGEFWDSLASLTFKMPSKTPYFRVLAVESTLPEQPQKEVIKVGARISNQAQVLPIDFISEMVKREPIIGVSECYCRLARDNRGDGHCEYPRETCFTFNELAQTLIETNLARKINPDEAIRILRGTEEAGLIHNVDNAQGSLKALCNCCPCCCPAVKSFKAGVRNVNAASRFFPLWHADRCTTCGKCAAICPLDAITSNSDSPAFHFDLCIGCGLCASHCPSHAIEMVLRQDLPIIPKTNDALWSQIRSEAIFNLIKQKIGGIFSFIKK